MNRQKKYNNTCKFYHFRFRKGSDVKYIDFMDSLENKTAFLRKAIDAELNK